MQKRWIAIGLGLVVALGTLVPGCQTDPDAGPWGPRTKNDDGTRKPRVLTTTVPLHCFTANIAEPYCEVRCLLTVKGAHGYESTIQDNRMISGADLLIANGLKFDNFVAKIKDQTANRNLKIIWTGDEIGEQLKSIGFDYVQAEAIQHGDHTHPAGNDMHVWLGHIEARLQCEVIRDALIDLDRARAEHYKTQTAKFLDQLDGLLREAAGLNELPGKFVTYHDSFKYFARSYLGSEKRISGSILGLEGEESGTAEFGRQLEKFAKDNVRVIGREPQYQDKLAKTVQAALMRHYEDDRVKIIVLDPLETGPPDGDTPYYVKKDHYIETMRQNIRNLKDALGHE